MVLVEVRVEVDDRSYGESSVLIEGVEEGGCGSWVVAEAEVELVLRSKRARAVSAANCLAPSAGGGGRGMIGIEVDEENR